MVVIVRGVLPRLDEEQNSLSAAIRQHPEGEISKSPLRLRGNPA
jgi:hypothetical protein